MNARVLHEQLAAEHEARRRRTSLLRIALVDEKIGIRRTPGRPTQALAESLVGVGRTQQHPAAGVSGGTVPVVTAMRFITVDAILGEPTRGVEPQLAKMVWPVIEWLLSARNTTNGAMSSILVSRLPISCDLWNSTRSAFLAEKPGCPSARQRNTPEALAAGFRPTLGCSTDRSTTLVTASATHYSSLLVTSNMTSGREPDGWSCFAGLSAADSFRHMMTERNKL